MTGRNYGLTGWRYVLWILIPAYAGAALGLKIGWAFAWRTLIAAELVFGASSGSGGSGGTFFRTAMRCIPTGVCRAGDGHRHWPAG
jgi:NitT/TauT family transport system permease protein